MKISEKFDISPFVSVALKNGFTSGLKTELNYVFLLYISIVLKTIFSATFELNVAETINFNTIEIYNKNT